MSDWLVKFAKFLNNYEVITDCEDLDYFYHYTTVIYGCSGKHKDSIRKSKCNL